MLRRTEGEMFLFLATQYRFSETCAVLGVFSRCLERNRVLSAAPGRTPANRRKPLNGNRYDRSVDRRSCARYLDVVWIIEREEAFEINAQLAEEAQQRWAVIIYGRKRTIYIDYERFNVDVLIPAFSRRYSQIFTLQTAELGKRDDLSSFKRERWSAFPRSRKSRGEEEAEKKRADNHFVSHIVSCRPICYCTLFRGYYKHNVVSHSWEQGEREEITGMKISE